MEQKTAAATSSSGTAAPHVTWDEETIAAHDLLRGTRQKIEEPNTPYHYYGSDHDDDDASAGELGAVSPARSASGREHEPKLEWGELQTKLQRVQDTKQRHASEWDSSDDEGSAGSKRSHFADRDEEGMKIVKDPKFAEKRKSHYNEYERMKAWRLAHANDEDEDEGDDENEEKEEAKMHD
ncbi:Phosphatase inhibitor 2 protein, partial [Globisporangium splendens]